MHVTTIEVYIMTTSLNDFIVVYDKSWRAGVPITVIMSFEHHCYGKETSKSYKL